jgi:acetolactate decarboxylase
MHQLNCTLSDGLWDLLQRRSKEASEPVSHIVGSALAAYFGVVHHTLHQVSTSTALVEGIYQGAVRVGTLRAYGDLGLGTFENLDGEMAIIDGHVYQVRSDGSVREVGDDVLSPFAAVTRFDPDARADLELCPDLEGLLKVFDRLRASENMFYALRVDGFFDAMHTRAMCKTEEGVPLVQAAAVQPEFHLRDVSGTLVGFWTPEYAKTLNVPGYHLHFLSDDRTQGGHVLGFSGSGLHLQLQRAADIHVALPETEDFLRGNLRRDPSADLAKAETAKK